MSALPTTDQLAARVTAILDECGATAPAGDLGGRTPITGGSLGPAGTAADVDAAVERATEAFRCGG